MATSGSVDFSLNARQIATAALQLLGVVALGEDPTGDEAAKALEHLNLMLKSWGADPKPKLWQLTEGSVTLLASTSSYVLTAARKVLSVRRRTGTGTSINDVPIDPGLSRQEYYDEPAKAATGTPRGWYFDPQRAARTLYVVGVPDATIAASTTLKYTYLRVIEDVDTLNDDFDLPQEWTEALQYSLAARLAVFFDLHQIHPTKATKIEEMAAMLYAKLSSFDDEAASVFMQPAS